jgi:hypothetical protein
MPRIAPPHLQAAFEQFREAWQSAQGGPFDEQKTPWADVEKGVIKLLGGPFRLDRPEHQAVAFGLAYVFGERLAEADGGFWFPNRDVPENAMIGFPDAILTVSPLGGVMDALRKANLGALEQMSQDIHRSIAGVKFSPQAGGGAKLQPEDYVRLFDPGFLQFVALDGAKLKTAWDSKPDKLAADIREAISRINDQEMPKEAKAQFEAQIVGALRKMDPAKPVVEQTPMAPRIVELMAHLFAAQNATGSAPAEFWDEVILPLLFIGSPENFPPLDEEELEAVEKGIDPLALFLDVVPFSTPAAEEGLLGVFPNEDLNLPHPAFAQLPSPRMIQLKPDRIVEALGKFDAAKARETQQRFLAYVQEKRGGKAVQVPPQSEQMREAAFTLLSDLKQVVESAKNGSPLILRRLTESEAMSEPAVSVVRKALSGPRIILA